MTLSMLNRGATAVLSLLAFLMVAVSCTTRLPLSRQEGTATTYSGGPTQTAQIFPPRSARAQKVVFDDPKARLIHERDTPFRRFFASRSKDFSDLDYAVTTILEDVLARLENRSYVRTMIEKVVEEHAERTINVRDTEPLAASTAARSPGADLDSRTNLELAGGLALEVDVQLSLRPEPADAPSKASEPQRIKDLREMRSKQLANAFHRLFSDLGYPYLDDQEIDDALQRVTGHGPRGWKKNYAKNQYPYSECFEAWHSLVADQSDIAEQTEAVKDLIRALHQALHDREFFFEVIADAVEKRKDLFKGSAPGRPSLSAFSSSTRKFITQRLDEPLREALVAGEDSLWDAFVATEFLAPNARLQLPPTAGVTERTFGQEVRKAVLKELGKKPKYSAEDFSKALTKVLASGTNRLWIVPETATGTAADAQTRAATKPLREAAGRDATVLSRYEQLVSAVTNELTTAFAEWNAARNDLNVADGGTSTGKASAAALASVHAARAAAVYQSVDGLKLDQWSDLTNATNAEFEELVTLAAKHAEQAEVEAARTARGRLFAAIEALRSDARFKRLSKLTGEVEKGERPEVDLLSILHASGNPLDARPTSEPDAVREANSFRTTLEVLFSKIPGALGNSLATYRARLDQHAGAMATARAQTTSQETKDAAKALQENAQARARLEVAEQARKTALELFRTRRKAVFDSLEEPMKAANEALPEQRKQDLDSLLESAESFVTAVTLRFEDGATNWTQTFADLDAFLQTILVRGALPDVQRALDLLIARFARVFSTNKELVESDDPIVVAFAKTANLGIKDPGYLTKARQTLPGAFASAVREADSTLPLAGTAPDSVNDENLVKRLEKALNKPSTSFLFSSPGSASRMDAFHAEFYQAFKHRLAEAVHAERPVDYDYWWLTFYPKAVPLGDETFEGESVIEIEFPAQAVPREAYDRWLADRIPGPRKGDDHAGKSEREEQLRKERVASVLTTLLTVLDEPSLAGRHPMARDVTQRALRVLLDPNEASLVTNEDDTYWLNSVENAVIREMADLPMGRDNRPDSEQIGGFATEIDCLAKRLRRLQNTRSLEPAHYDLALRNIQGDRLQLCKQAAAHGISDHYRSEIRWATADELEDLAELGKYLSQRVAPPTEERGEDQRNRAELRRRNLASGARRALARAPFGLEHILFSIVAAHDDRAVLPNLVDLYTNAFFDGVERFALDADECAAWNEKEQLKQFLLRSGVRVSWNTATAPPDVPGFDGTLCPCQIDSDKELDEFFGVLLSIETNPEGKTNRRARQSAPERLAFAQPPVGPPSAETQAYTALIGGVLGSRLSGMRCEVCPSTQYLEVSWPRRGSQAPADKDASRLGWLSASSRRNGTLARPELWVREAALAKARANLRKTIVHSYTASYPGVPSNSTIQASVSQLDANLLAFAYELVRDAWIITQQENLLSPKNPQNRSRANPPEVANPRRFRSLLRRILTYNDLLPEGLARDVIGEFESRHAPRKGIDQWIQILASNHSVMDHLREKLVAHLYPGLWNSLRDMSETRFHEIPFKRITRTQYEGFLKIAQPALQPGVQVIELLPSSRDDLVSMSINEGGSIAQIAAQADAAATYDVNEAKMVLAAVNDLTRTSSALPADPEDPLAIANAADTTVESRSFLDQLSRASEATEAVSYNLGGTAQADLYARAKAAFAYSRRREYLDAAITAAGRGDRFGKWVIRPSDLRSELAGTNGNTLVAAAHSGYPNGDQPFHMLVKVPHRAMHVDSAGRNHLYFNSSYAATKVKNWSDNLGLLGWVSRGLMFIVHYPFSSGDVECAVGVKYPFQWDVTTREQQRNLFQTPNMLGGRIELDSTDKIKYSEVKKLLDAEAGFIATTRTKQSESLNRVMGEIEAEREKISGEVREQIRKKIEDARKNGDSMDGN